MEITAEISQEKEIKQEGIEIESCERKLLVAERYKEIL